MSIRSTTTRPESATCTSNVLRAVRVREDVESACLGPRPGVYVAGLAIGAHRAGNFAACVDAPPGRGDGPGHRYLLRAVGGRPHECMRLTRREVGAHDCSVVRSTYRGCAGNAGLGGLTVGRPDSWSPQHRCAPGHDHEHLSVVSVSPSTSVSFLLLIPSAVFASTMPPDAVHEERVQDRVAVVVFEDATDAYPATCPASLTYRATLSAFVELEKVPSSVDVPSGLPHHRRASSRGCGAPIRRRRRRS